MILPNAMNLDVHILKEEQLYLLCNVQVVQIIR